jgi:hypothetical protein
MFAWRLFRLTTKRRYIMVAAVLKLWGYHLQHRELRQWRAYAEVKKRGNAARKNAKKDKDVVREKFVERTRKRRDRERGEKAANKQKEQDEKITRALQLATMPLKRTDEVGSGTDANDVKK